MFQFSIDRRVDQGGLPYQFYIKFARPDGELRELVVHYSFEGNTVYRLTSDLRSIADNIDAAYERELARVHASDCAVHNEPAMPAGLCDCKEGGA